MKGEVDFDIARLLYCESAQRPTTCRQSQCLIAVVDGQVHYDTKPLSAFQRVSSLLCPPEHPLRSRRASRGTCWKQACSNRSRQVYKTDRRRLVVSIHFRRHDAVYLFIPYQYTAARSPRHLTPFRALLAMSRCRRDSRVCRSFLLRRRGKLLASPGIHLCAR